MAEERKTRMDFDTDSEWYTYQVTHPEVPKDKSDTNSNKKHEKGIFMCEKCGYIIDETDKYFDKVQGKNIKRDSQGNILKCPKCGADKKSLKKIDKDKKNEILRKRRLKEEKEQTKKLDIAKENIKDDIVDLLEDLSIRLKRGEINVDRFVVVFMHLSQKIIDRYAKDLDIDWLDYRKSMLAMSKTVTDLYDVQIDGETILEEYDKNINDDKLYLAEYKYYIEDDKYSIADYELSERIKEYENMQSNLFKEERNRELEEKYQERRKELEEKAELRIQRRIERNIVK